MQTATYDFKKMTNFIPTDLKEQLTKFYFKDIKSFEKELKNAGYTSDRLSSLSGLIEPLMKYFKTAQFKTIAIQTEGDAILSFIVSKSSQLFSLPEGALQKNDNNDWNIKLIEKNKDIIMKRINSIYFIAIRRKAIENLQKIINDESEQTRLIIPNRDSFESNVDANSSHMSDEQQESSRVSSQQFFQPHQDISYEINNLHKMKIQYLLN